MKMNSPEGKAILSLVRNGDFAHPGEIEAIQMLFKGIEKDSSHKILDIGCGRGGTADYLNVHGYKNVYGMDIDAESINYATARYSNVTFKSGDVLDLEEIFKFKFDLIYLFNSFYAFTEQLKSLSIISKITEPKAELLIFEYLDLTGDFKGLTEPKVSYWTPIRTDILKVNLSILGWKEITFKDISLDYERWYKDLCSKIKKLEPMITEQYGKEWFDFVYDFYLYVVNIIEQKILGGVIVHAKR